MLTSLTGRRRTAAGPIRTVIACTLAMLVIAWPPLLVSVLSLRIGLNAGQLGLVVAVFFAAAGALSPGGAAAVRRHGASACLVVGLTVTILVGALLAVTSSVVVLGGLLILSGAANALVQPSTNSIIRMSMAGAARGFAIGVVQASVPLTAVASAAVIPLVPSGSSGRAAFLLLALGGLVALLLLPGVGTAPEAERQRDGLAGVAAGPPSVLTTGSSGRFRILPFVVLAFCAAMAASAMSAFAVSSGVALGMTSASVAGWLAVAGGTCAIVRVAASRAAAVSSGRQELPGTVTITVLVLLGLLGALGLALGRPLLFGTSLVVGYGFGWAWNGALNLTTALRAPSPTVATGWTQAGVFAGSACGPLLFGALLTHGASHAQAWQLCVLAMAAALTVGAWLVGREFLRSTSPSAP